MANKKHHLAQPHLNLKANLLEFDRQAIRSTERKTDLLLPF